MLAFEDPAFLADAAAAGVPIVTDRAGRRIALLTEDAAFEPELTAKHRAFRARWWPTPMARSRPT